MAVILRNSISNERMEIEPLKQQTVEEAVNAAGFVQGPFSVRDKSGQIIDHEQIMNYDGQVISVGMQSGTVEGGGDDGK